MRLNNDSKPLVVIVGPTAVGKTELAVRLAESFEGEIVSADSRQFYIGMDIGTAKPSLSDRGRVRHHLIDVTHPDHPWSLAVFQQAAKDVIAGIHARGKLPFLVGGTGQYVHAVVEDWEVPPQPPDHLLRSVLERIGNSLGPEEFYRRLSLIDPEAARHIEPRNLRRTVRAFEVMLLTGRKFSSQRQKGISPYQTWSIGLTRPRVALYQRVDERIEQMVADGLLDEVKGLLAQGYAANLPPFSAIGYREMIRVLEGEIALEEAIILMKRATRQYIRRQANWFRSNDPQMRWFDLSHCTFDEIARYLSTQVEKNRPSSDGR